MKPLALVLFLATFVTAEPLSPAAEKFARDLESASWGGSASAGPIQVRAKNLGFCSQGMLDLVRSEEMPEAARAAMKELIEFEVKEDGWLLRVPVTAGRYLMGIERGPKNLRLVLRTEAGELLVNEGLWITVPTDEKARVGVSSRNGASLVEISCAGIRLVFRYVSERAHEAALGKGLKAYEEGPIVLHSDLPCEDALRAVAAECAAAVPLHADLLGRPAPAGSIHLYLVGTRDAYNRADQLLTDGAFAQLGAFTSDLTRRVYYFYWLPTSAEAFADHGIPMKFRAILLHEVFHAVAYMSREESAYWPRWIAEGLAELGCERALPREAQRAFIDLYLGQWRAGDEIETTPVATDLISGEMAGRATAWYTSAWLFMRRLHKNPADLSALLVSLENTELSFEMAGVARAELEAKYGPVHRLWEEVRESARREAKGLPAIISGVMDTVDGNWRVASAGDNNASILMPLSPAGDRVSIETDFALHAAGARQADLYLGWNHGRDSDEFLKLALMPTAITLFQFRDGRWVTLGNVKYDQPLEVSAAGKLHWHSATASYDRKTKKLRVDFATGRWAEFHVPDHVTIEGSSVGFGTWGSAVTFRNFRLK